MGCYRTPKQLFSNQFAVYLVKSGAETHVAEREGTGIIQGEGGRARIQPWQGATFQRIARNGRGLPRTREEKPLRSDTPYTVWS